ncbi:unnamed protein product, partial [Effrenium voratum]
VASLLGPRSDDDIEHRKAYLHFRDRLLLIAAQAPAPACRCAKRRRMEGERCRPRPALQLALEGFWAPLQILSPNEAREALLQLDAHAARVIGPKARAEDLQGAQRFKVHLLYPWAAALVRCEGLLRAAREALGSEDLLVWFSEVNAKAAHSDCHAAPHQDGIFASLAPNDAVVTAWLA